MCFDCAQILEDNICGLAIVYFLLLLRLFLCSYPFPVNDKYTIADIQRTISMSNHALLIVNLKDPLEVTIDWNNF